MTPTSNAPIVGRNGPIRGPCKNCGGSFRSYDAKRKFCSVRCYTTSQEFLDRIRKHPAAQLVSSRAKLGLPPDKEIKCRCLACEADFVVLKVARIRKFCSPTCRRKWFAERFDRWIANPESLMLPQNYDEFFTQNILPCPVNGCGWEGKCLGWHANSAHGITADKMRELMGCNKSTGLCTPEISEYHRMIAITRGLPDFANKWSKDNRPPGGARELRQEGRERSKKVQALQMNTPNGKTVPCRTCGKDVPQMMAGRAWYCNPRCRLIYYEKRKSITASCAQCGLKFETRTINQSSRARKGFPVYCNVFCRQRANSHTDGARLYQQRGPRDSLGRHTREVQHPKATAP